MRRDERALQPGTRSEVVMGQSMKCLIGLVRDWDLFSFSQFKWKV